MASTAQKSQGATIGKGDGASPEVFTTIANITSISGPNLEAADIEVTDLSSTAKEFLQGLEDSGTIDLEGFYDQTNTQHQEMRDNVGANTAVNYKITLTQGSPAETITFSARVMSFSIGHEVDGAVTMSMSLKIDGSVTWSS